MSITPKKTTEERKQYKVLLEQMTPVYTLVTVTAIDEDEAAAIAEEMADEAGGEWAHDRLPDEDTWSFIPPVDIFNPTEDGPSRALQVYDGETDISQLSCLDTDIVASDGSIVTPDFMERRGRDLFIVREEAARPLVSAGSEEAPPKDAA